MTDERRGFFKRNGRDYELSYSLGDAQPYKVRFYRGDAWRPFETAEAREAHIKAWFAKNVPLGYEEAVHGDDPGPLHLTTCTGCGFALADGGVGTHCQNCGKPWAEADAYTETRTVSTYGTGPDAIKGLIPPRIAPDEVRVNRELLQAVLDTVKVVAAGPLDEDGCCFSCCRPMFGRNGTAQPNNHTTECPVRLARAQREALDAALAAASGDDGGTP